MAPILGRYGPFLIYTYTVIMGAGVLLGLGWTIRRRRASPGTWIDRVLVALLGGILGGRLAFILLNWTYFDDRLDSALNLWRGGINFHGALLGGALIFWLWPARPGPALLDALAPGILLLSVAGWLACYYEGCAYGAETTLGIWAADLPDAYGVYAVRYQTQLLGVAGSGLALGILLWLDRRRMAPDRLFWLALLGVVAIHGVLTLLRGDPQPLLGSWRLDTLLDLVLGGIAAVKAALPTGAS